MVGNKPRRGGPVKVSRRKRRPGRFGGSKPPQLPPGFTPAVGDTPESALEKIESWLRALSEWAEGRGIHTKMRVAQNPDGSIDAQLDLDFPPDADDTLMALPEEWSDIVQGEDLSSGYFLQVGNDYSSQDVEVMAEMQKSGDRRYRGFERYLAYWYRADKYVNAVIAAGVVNDNVEDRYEGEQITVRRILWRIHWSPQDVSPATGRPTGKGYRR